MLFRSLRQRTGKELTHAEGGGVLLEREEPHDAGEGRPHHGSDIGNPSESSQLEPALLVHLAPAEEETDSRDTEGKVGENDGRCDD